MFKLSQINNTTSFLNFYREIGGSLKYSFSNKKCKIEGTKVEADFIDHNDIIEFSNKNNMKISYTYNMWYGNVNIPSSFNSIIFNNKNNVKISYTYTYNMRYGNVNIPASFNSIIFSENSIAKYLNPIYYIVKSIKNKSPSELLITLDKD